MYHFFFASWFFWKNATFVVEFVEETNKNQGFA
jgi:hypothetical protein